MWPWNASTQGEVYLFHFHQPLGNLSNRRAMASHYVGFSDNLPARLEEQLAGKGAKIVAAALARGITFDIYHWPATLKVEKLIKARHNTAVYCPTCARMAGRLPRPLPVPATQLELPLLACPAEGGAGEPLPDAPEGRADWLEYHIQQQWRQARQALTATAIDLAALDDDLL